ncbi:MAG: 6-phosphofructokinase [Phycisphaeraceae bacterium]|nr:6-phosphofructokinase [Phycisphaeraceae bacterium]
MANRLIEGAAVIGQSGGPTAVINQSLVGVIEGLRGYKPIRRILGMRHGVDGMIRALPFADLSNIDSATLDAVARTPGAALGSSRAKPTEADAAKIFEACKANDIRYFFYIGGNDSADTCRIVYEMGVRTGYELRCIHVPKTVDNDLVGHDHTPGYGSAARYVAMAFMADDRDNASLPGIKINVVMGRHAGFLTAASALARRDESGGPHLIYLPEVPFDTDRFIEDVKQIVGKYNRCQIAVSEGIKDKEGVEIGARLIAGAQTDAHGNVQLSGSGALGDLLANVVKERFKSPSGKPPRVRADTLGYLQRCWPEPSQVDSGEARKVGQRAALEAVNGGTDGSVAMTRKSNHPYRIEHHVLRLSEVAAKTRTMPAEFIRGHHDVSREFLEFVTPLVGELPRFGKL